MIVNTSKSNEEVLLVVIRGDSEMSVLGLSGRINLFRTDGEEMASFLAEKR